MDTALAISETISARIDLIHDESDVLSGNAPGGCATVVAQDLAEIDPAQAAVTQPAAHRLAPHAEDHTHLVHAEQVHERWVANAPRVLAPALTQRHPCSHSVTLSIVLCASAQR